MDRWNKEQAGVYFDSSRGIHIGLEVLELCLSLGMKDRDFDLSDVSSLAHNDPYSEFYHEVWSECEQWLNENVARAGYYFGSLEGGDWGYFEASQELSFWR